MYDAHSVAEDIVINLIKKFLTRGLWWLAGGIAALLASSWFHFAEPTYSRFFCYLAAALACCVSFSHIRVARRTINDIGLLNAILRHQADTIAQITGPHRTPAPPAEEQP